MNDASRKLVDRLLEVYDGGDEGEDAAGDFGWENWEAADKLPLIRLKNGSLWRIDTDRSRLYREEDPDEFYDFLSPAELADYLERYEDKDYENVGSRHQFVSTPWKEPEAIPLQTKLTHEVSRYGNFAVLKMPHDEDFIRREGHDMQHCLISAYKSYCERARAGEIELYSLIDLTDGDPKVDIEVALTVSSYQGKVPYPIVYQIRGKRNECPPKDEYIPALMHFFDTYGGERNWKLSGHGFRNFDGKVDGDRLVERWMEIN